MLKHNYIRTEHPLRKEDGLAARVLDLLDLSADHVRAGVTSIVGSGEEVSPDQIPFTPLRTRREMLSGYMVALERREEMVRAIGETDSRNSARQAIEKLLGLTEVPAGAVLDLRLWRLSRDQLERFAQELRDIDARELGRRWGRWRRFSSYRRQNILHPTGAPGRLMASAAGLERS
jgi:hypothetical protein